MSTNTPKSHRYAPWRRAVLVPYWAVHILSMSVYIALLSLALSAVLNYPDDYGISDDLEQGMKIVTGVWMTFCIITILLTVTEIVLLVKNKLTPLKFLITNAIKTTIWTGLTIVDFVALAREGAYNRYDVRRTIIFGVAFLISFWGFFLYAISVFQKSRESGAGSRSDALLAPNGGPPAPYDPIAHSGGAAEFETHPYQSPMVNNGKYENFRSSRQNHEYAGIGDNTPMMNASPVPDVYVQHHDNVYEMNSRSTVR